MIRFRITNKTDGTKYVREGEIGPASPLWGKPAHQEQALTDDGHGVYDADGKPVMVDVPSEFDVVEEDMAAEIAANDAKKAAKQARKDRLKTHNPKAGGANNIANILQDILDELNGN